MSQGRKSNVERIALVQQLRSEGMTWQAIGTRLGVTRQCAHCYLHSNYRPRRRHFHCRTCNSAVDSVGATPRDDRRALCLPCVERAPGATFADALRSYRLAAGLSQAELARRSGVSCASVCESETGQSRPRSRTLAKLVAVLPGLEHYVPEQKT